MGMNVYGTDPRSEKGRYFRNTVWYWHPLADYVCLVAPSITATCRDWHSNDGDGLNDEDSRSLAAVLREELNSGRTARYAEMRWPLEANGHGGLSPVDHVGDLYQFNVDNVRAFAEFLEHCGGFEIQ